MTCEEFARNGIDACAAADIVVECAVLLYDEPVVKLRVDLRDSSFIDVFYNADAGRVSFAWIKSGQRIFGADNTRGWHIHPLSDPGSHQSHPPMSFERFLSEVRQHIE